MRSRRTAVAMIAAAGAMLLATATGAAAAQQESPYVYCEYKSPDERGGECKGTESRDVIDGTEFNDRIAALGAPDAVHAYAGDDRVEGGPGGDLVYGGRGDDALYGGEGKDSFSDKDPFGRSDYGPPDTDRVSGGADADRIDVRDGDTGDVVSCGKGKDTVWYDKTDTDSDKLYGCEVRNPNPPYIKGGS